VRKAGSNCEDCRSKPHERNVVARFTDEEPAGKCGQGYSDSVWKDSDAGPGSRSAFDGLKIEGHEVCMHHCCDLEGENE